MQKYYEEAARILTKVFNASRLETEVSPDMVELLISERELEKERSSAVIEKIKQILTDAHFESERENVLVHSSGHEVILSGRIKTVVSAMYNLLATKNGEHQNLNDMLGLMIICEDVKTCYELRDLLSDKLVEIGDTIISEKDMILTGIISPTCKPISFTSLNFVVANAFVFDLPIIPAPISKKAECFEKPVI